MKKMRRLIPAFAMLMVAAIMLSTASFAWFTMNETVTATGMSVQAQASGSMVIGEKALTELDNGIKVDFGVSGSKTITPITHFDATADVDDDVEGWAVPNADPDKNEVVDPLTGKYDGTWKVATLANGTNCVMYTVYIAVAGDSETANIEAKVTVDTKVNITDAYTIAFYVDKDDAAIIAGATPDQKINVLNGASTTVNRKLFSEAKAIPSTIGVTDPANGVGIKVTMVVYVDGNLPSSTKVDVKVPTYALQTTYDSTKTYYEKVGEDYVLAQSANLGLKDNDDITDKNWYIYEGMKASGEQATVYYVNNAWAPATPSGLNVAFSMVDIVPKA